MKRVIVTSVVAAGLFVVAGCSSSGSSTSSSTVASTTTAASTSAGSSANGGAAPAELDAQSTTWFETLCSGVAPVAELAKTADTSGLSDAAAQQKGVELITQFGAALSDTGATLADTPPPTFDGGEEFATTMSNGLTESGSQMADLAKSFGSIDPTDTAALEEAVASLPDDLSAAVAPLSAIGDLDAGVSAAAQEIPSCQQLG